MIGVVETCRESFHRFDRYLNFSNSENFDPRTCGWAFGMNIFDLKKMEEVEYNGRVPQMAKFGKRNIFVSYTNTTMVISFFKHYFILQNHNKTFAVDKSWHLLGLGYYYGPN